MLKRFSFHCALQKCRALDLEVSRKGRLITDDHAYSVAG
jgi:hypothetical protein